MRINPLHMMTIIAWNIYIGAGVKQARAALEEFKDKISPDIIVLMEATNLYGDLGGLGYEVVQLKPRSLRPGSRPGQANIAMLIDKKQLEIKKRFTLRMLVFWRGPKHGWAQDPRVYRWVKVRKVGTKKWWKVGAAHTPFGEAARNESRKKLVNWLRNTLPGRPTVLVIDANMSRGMFKEQIADPGGASVTGAGIDLGAYKHCWVKDFENLGRGISDHPAHCYEFVAGKKP